MRGHAALNARVRAGVDAWAAYEGCLLAYSSASTDWHAWTTATRETRLRPPGFRPLLWWPSLCSLGKRHIIVAPVPLAAEGHTTVRWGFMHDDESPGEEFRVHKTVPAHLSDVLYRPCSNVPGKAIFGQHERVARHIVTLIVTWLQGKRIPTPVINMYIPLSLPCAFSFSLSPLSLQCAFFLPSSLISLCPVYYLFLHLGARVSS